MSDTDRCSACHRAALITLPVTGIVGPGAIAAGSVTLCEHCGTPQEVTTDCVVRLDEDS